MIRVTTTLKFVVVVAAAALFLTFSRLTLALLVPGTIGIALVIFGIAMRYKPASVLGLFVTLVVVALSLEIETLTDTDLWMSSIFGFLVPTCLLAWSSLLSENDETYELRFRTRAFVVASCSGVALAAAVPAVAASSGMAFPTMRMTLSTLAEISILFLVMAVMSLTLIRSQEETPAADETE
jgi:hypothetical protein